MLDDERIEAAVDVFQSRLDRVKAKYLRLVGEHIAKIGKLDSESVSIIEQLRKMDVNMRTIEAELAAALRMDARDVDALLKAAAKSVYGDAAKFYNQPAFKDNFMVNTILTGQSVVTQGALSNLSQTRLVSKAYRQAVDDAVTAVQTGAASYNTAIESALREVAGDGLRVRYPSGATRRVDTAMRQNVLDGVRSINQRIAQQVGTEFDADGVEISAHMDCAMDHLDIQGRQFTKAGYEQMNSMLARPIGWYNCKHFAFPIVIGVSSPSRTDAEIEELREQSAKQITIDGVTKTRYDWTQEQRRIETAVRYQKDAATIAKAAGADDMVRNAESQIAALRKQYYHVSKAAGIPTQYDRMKVAGYVPVK